MALVILVNDGLDVIFQALGRSSDLTGRTDIWDAVKKPADM
jgi:hypothetical protein